MGYDINQVIEGIVNAQNMGRNPQMIIQQLIQKNPQTQQMLTQLKNMANGRPMNEFVMQLARQNGVSEQNLRAMQNMFNRRY